jgi:hypothetical protein
MSCDWLTELDWETAAKIKAMLSRGDEVVDIAIWFGVPERSVDLIRAGATHGLVPHAPAFALPPRGPYKRANGAYGALERIRAAEAELQRVSRSVRQSHRT